MSDCFSKCRALRGSSASGCIKCGFSSAIFAVYKGCLCAEDEKGRRFHLFPETLPVPNKLPFLLTPSWETIIFNWQQHKAEEAWNKLSLTSAEKPNLVFSSQPWKRAPNPRFQLLCRDNYSHLCCKLHLQSAQKMWPGLALKTARGGLCWRYWGLCRATSRSSPAGH